MKYIKLFEEVSNLSKMRKWPNYSSTHGLKGRNDSDLYFTYNLPKKDIGKYLNTWFEGETIMVKNGVIIHDERITLKKVDEETANHLYRRDINPVSIWITQSKNGRDMKAQIHSIDDSSYGIWWIDSTEDLDSIRTTLMDWINKQPILNGEKFLDYCVSLGADEDQKDYN